MTDDSPDRRHFEALLEFLKRQRGIDFSGYKRSTLERRLRKRMEDVNVPGYAEYLDHLQVHPDEFSRLFDTLLINVTGFFRDAAAWEYVDRHVVPALARALEDNGELRLWSAGCASGEEPYSIAMLLVRALGEEAVRDRVKIYATDIDEAALTEGRHGAFSAEAIEDVPADLLERCFERTEQHYAFRRDLRRTVIFGRNDLVQDAPISRVDLLLCRNTLMYFTAETQSRILARLNFALRPDGHLFLGKSEMLLTHGDLFTPVNLKHRVFAKVARATLRERLAFVTNGDEAPAERVAGAQLRGEAFDAGPVAAIVADRNRDVVAINYQARTTFGLLPADVGRPLQDLEISYQPIELRAAVDRAIDDKRAVRLGEVAWRRSAGGELLLDVDVTPLDTDRDGVQGVMVTFSDVTSQAKLRDELDRSKHELSTAYEELQSTIEELETTNEELQSTNEELETTNEELQSTNEELETMNDELRERTTELDSVNSSMDAILTSLAVGVAVVDGDQVVQVWNTRADDLWGMRSEEAVGQPVSSLDIGLPVERLGIAVRDALAGTRHGPLVLDATNRRGKSIRCKVTAVPLTADGQTVRGAILLMEADGAAG